MISKGHEGVFVHDSETLKSSVIIWDNSLLNEGIYPSIRAISMDDNVYTIPGNSQTFQVKAKYLPPV